MSVGTGTQLENANRYFPQYYVNNNNLIIEQSSDVLLFAQRSDGLCGLRTNAIIYGNSKTCLFWQNTPGSNARQPDHGKVLKALMKIQDYIDFGMNITGYSPYGASPVKTYVGQDGITRKWVIELNDALCKNYGGASYNGRPWNALTKDQFWSLHDTINDPLPVMHQVFYYELGRSMWDVELDDIWDWQMQNSGEYGYWTLGFNGTMTALAPAQIGLEMDYYGTNATDFEQDRLRDLRYYRLHRVYNFENTWTEYLLPWSQGQSINDLMSGLLIDLCNKLGGMLFLQRFFRFINRRRATPSRTDRIERARNFYTAVKYAYSTIERYNPTYDIEDLFRNEYKWGAIFENWN